MKGLSRCFSLLSHRAPVGPSCSSKFFNNLFHNKNALALDTYVITSMCFVCELGEIAGGHSRPVPHRTFPQSALFRYHFPVASQSSQQVSVRGVRHTGRMGSIRRVSGAFGRKVLVSTVSMRFEQVVDG